MKCKSQDTNVNEIRQQASMPDAFSNLTKNCLKIM